MTELMGEGAGAAPARGRARPKIVGVEGIENALELAALTLRPDEVSGRQLVKRLMPHLFKLRKKGFSYAQLTRLINDAIGGKNARLQPGTVKAYYHEFIAEKQDECEEQFKASLQIIAEVEKLTAKSTQQLVTEATQLKTACSVSRGATAPSAPVFTAQMKAGDLVVPDLPVPNAASIDQDLTMATTPASRATEEVPVVAALSIKTSDAHEPSATTICVTVPTPNKTHPTSADIFTANPPVFFSDTVLEHPDVPGLMLTRDQRLHTTRLEYTVNGVPEMETVKQMYNRYKWRSVPQATPSRTEGDFVKMDMSLFTPNA